MAGHEFVDHGDHKLHVCRQETGRIGVWGTGFLAPGVAVAVASAILEEAGYGLTAAALNGHIQQEEDRNALDAEALALLNIARESFGEPEVTDFDGVIPSTQNAYRAIARKAREMHGAQA